MVHNGVSDDEYAELLGQAFALVHASLDEGFGIPLIEAMARRHAGRRQRHPDLP